MKDLLAFLYKEEAEFVLHTFLNPNCNDYESSKLMDVTECYKGPGCHTTDDIVKFEGLKYKIVCSVCHDITDTDQAISVEKWEGDFRAVCIRPMEMGLVERTGGRQFKVTERVRLGYIDA